MTRWNSLQEDREYIFGLMQIDVVGHSRWLAPDISQKQTKENLRKYVSSFAEHNLGIRELHWAGDGGSYFIPITDPRKDYDALVYCAIHILHSLNQFNNLPILNTMGIPLTLRISCHEGRLIYGADYANLHGRALNYFLKHEREIGSSNTVTITEEIYQRITSVHLHNHFTQIESHEYTVGNQTYTNRLFRYATPSEPQAEIPTRGDYASNLGVAADKKALVARYVVDNNFVKDTSSYLLDAGTSVFHVAKAFVDEWRNRTSRWSKLTIRTHNLACWTVLQAINDGSVDTWLIGGRFNYSLNAFLDPREFPKLLENFFPTVVVVGVDAISKDGIFYCGERDEYPIKRQIVRCNTEALIIVAHDDKIGKRKGERFATLPELFGARCDRVHIITNSPVSDVPSAYATTRDFIRTSYGETALIEV